MFLNDFECFAPAVASPTAVAQPWPGRELSPWDRWLKRGVDISGSLAFFLLLGWFFFGLWLVVAVKQGRPGIYKHKRIGRDGKEFECLKFRSMVRNADQVLAAYLESSPAAKAEWSRDFKLRNDPRITPLGQFLRRTSLDELPQFWNVLKGDMSLVGPRPIVRTELEKHYRGSASHYVQVRPGITGPWQVSGRHGQLTYDQRIELDCSYARGWTNAGDFKILLKTIAVVVRRDGSV